MHISAAQKKMAKWMVPEFESRSPEGLYVKNIIEFVDKIKEVQIMPNDILVSFDAELSCE
jgi:hypothetical protein